MMYAWESWKHTFAERLSVASGADVQETDIIVPPKPDMGDLCFGCFRLAKERGVSPADLAKELASKLKADHTDFASFEATGPYVNAHLSVQDATYRVVREIEELGNAYGEHPHRNNDPWMFEYANPNTHKEIHVGHLRGFLLGVSIVRCARSAGYNIHPVSFVNDLGSNVAKCLWQLVTLYGHAVEDISSKKEAEAILQEIAPADRTGKFLGTLYTQATRALEENEALKTAISDVQSRLERHEEGFEHLWRETRRWCLDELRGLFQELGVDVEDQYLESSFIDQSIAIVSDLEKRGIARISEGALIVDLEEEKLPPALLRKTDGTHLYLAKDLALAEQKVHDLPGLSRSTVLVDYRQSLHFKQLSAVLKRMGFSQTFDMCGLEIVTLPGGAMSSRKGNIITLQTFIDEVKAYARAQVLERHDEWPEGKVEHSAWAIAQAGMKFGMLKQDADKVFTFDMKQALAFDGDTGPYCQYAVTRYTSVLRKQGWRPESQKKLTRAFSHPLEKRLALLLAQFPDRIISSAVSLRPSIMSQWCIETAQCMNEVYRDVPVQDASAGDKEARLHLFSSAKTVLERGLWMLGIPVPEEM